MSDGPEVEVGMGVGSVRVESGSSGDTESEVHGVCVGGVITYDRRMQACGVACVSAEARMVDACRRREASVHVPETRDSQGHVGECAREG